jgi:Flp pilus assembly protein TadG
MDMIERSRKSFRAGTTVVETAFVLPLLLLLTMGAIEYGWLLYNVQQITNAARQGARMAILPHAGAATEAQTMMNKLLNEAGLPQVAPLPESYDINGQPGVRVHISISTAGLSLVHAPSLIPIPGAIGATVTMAKEGS